MNVVFADTFYYFALLNPADECHDRARKFTAGFTGSIVSTAWIFTELADGLCRGPNRTLFMELIASVRTDPDVRIIPPGAEMFEDGLALYSRRPDKEWSLTDCISFAVMERERITSALTADHHFQQVGFVPLLI